jgi:hypothetical protein
MGTNSELFLSCGYAAERPPEIGSDGPKGGIRENARQATRPFGPTRRIRLSRSPEPFAWFKRSILQFDYLATIWSAQMGSLATEIPQSLVRFEKSSDHVQQCDVAKF